MTRATLPRPISDFQGIEVEDPAFVDHLFAALVKHFGVTKTPRVDAEKMKSQIAAAISISTVASRGEQRRIHSADSEAAGDRPVSTKQQLPDGTYAVLQFLGNQSKAPSAAEIAEGMNIPIEEVRYHLDELDREDLIIRMMPVEGDLEYGLSNRGRRMVFQRDLP
jgi:hypothetical protein